MVLSTALELEEEKKTKQKELEKLEAPAELPKKGLPPGTIDLTPQSRSYSSWRGEATPCFIRKNVVGHTAFLLPSRNLPNIDRL